LNYADNAGERNTSGQADEASSKQLTRPGSIRQLTRDALSSPDVTGLTDRVRACTRHPRRQSRSHLNTTELRVYEALASGQKTIFELQALLGLQPANLRKVLRPREPTASSSSTGQGRSTWHHRPAVIFHCNLVTLCGRSGPRMGVSLCSGSLGWPLLPPDPAVSRCGSAGRAMLWAPE
jgi:hypothetical protein